MSQKESRKDAVNINIQLKGEAFRIRNSYKLPLTVLIEAALRAFDRADPVVRAQCAQEAYEAQGKQKSDAADNTEQAA